MNPPANNQANKPEASMATYATADLSLSAFLQTRNHQLVEVRNERGTQITDHISRQIKTVTGKDDVSVHTFRHTHISHAVNRWGRHPSVVQRWVGQKDLNTTMQYIHVSAEDLHREALKTGLSG